MPGLAPSLESVHHSGQGRRVCAVCKPRCTLSTCQLKQSKLGQAPSTADRRRWARHVVQGRADALDGNSWRLVEDYNWRHSCRSESKLMVTANVSRCCMAVAPIATLHVDKYMAIASLAMERTYRGMCCTIFVACCPSL